MAPIVPTPLRISLLLASLCGGVGLAGPAWALDNDDSLRALLVDSGAVEGPALAGASLRELLRHDFVVTVDAEQSLRELILEAEAGSTGADGKTWRREVTTQAILAALNKSGPEGIGGTEYDIPLADHKLVDVYIDYFSGRGRKFFRRWLARADRYKPIMQPILRKHGLPEDTIYLAMIESGFVAHAYSTAAASGFWQFIASTGRTYELRQTPWVDERRDFIKATHSAARFLTDLHRRFGDWHLAWAAYNAGGGRISRLMKRSGKTTYWELIDVKRGLAKETQHYVPKIIAAAIIAKNRKHFGFHEVEALPSLGWDEVPVDGAVELRRVAEHLGVSLRDLKTLNPSLLYDLTPPGRNFTLRVPEGRGEKTQAWLASLPAHERFRYNQHVVARGDTLWKIADALDTTVAAVQQFNGIDDPRSLRPGQRLLVPILAGSMSRDRARAVARAPETKTKSRSARSSSRSQRPRKRHVVSAGETLWSISQRYEVSVASLKTWNGRRSTQIGVGEVLKIF